MDLTGHKEIKMAARAMSAQSFQKEATILDLVRERYWCCGMTDGRECTGQARMALMICAYWITPPSVGYDVLTDIGKIVLCAATELEYL